MKFVCQGESRMFTYLFVVGGNLVITTISSPTVFYRVAGARDSEKTRKKTNDERHYLKLRRGR